MNLVHALPSCFLKTHFNIVLPFTPTSFKRYVSFRFSSRESARISQIPHARFPHQKPVHTSPLSHTCYMPSLSHSSRFYHPNNIGWGVQIIPLLIMQFPPLSCYSSLLGPNILLNTLFSNTFSLRPSIHVSFTLTQNNRKNYSSVYLNL